MERPLLHLGLGTVAGILKGIFGSLAATFMAVVWQVQNFFQVLRCFLSYFYLILTGIPATIETTCVAMEATDWLS